jgi:phospholipid/cholesterol/gamma-HCH transport system substrate-binding protein
MPTKKQAALAELRVGIFVSVALFLLALFIVSQNWGLDIFSRNVEALTYLPDVGGLKPGAPVWLAGIEVGKVRKVTIVPPEVFAGNAPLFQQIEEIKHQIQALDPHLPGNADMIDSLTDRLRNLKQELRLVEVQLEIRSQFLNRISRDSEVSIGSKGLIGDSFLEISPGTYGVPPDLRGGFYIIEGLRTTGFREIITGANDVIANFGVLAGQVKNIAMKINPDKVGTGVAQTVEDLQDTLRRAQKTFDRATLLLDELRAGQGSFGKMVSDPALYRQLTEALERLNDLTARIQNGSGTLSKFINDPSIYDQASRTLNRAESIVERMERGDGTLGRLSKDPALFDSSKQTIERLNRVLDKIEQGEGTIGKLFKDPSLYQNLNQSSAEITKLIYDLRQDPKKYLTIRFRLF